jgi:hypothetical protein
MCGLESCKSLRLRNDWASRYAPRMPFTVSHAAADRDEKPPAVSRRGFSINYLLDVERLDVASVSAPYISIPTIPPMPRGAPPWARSGEELKIMELRKLRRTRREILKNAALAAFAAPAIGQGRTTLQPDTSAKPATFVLVHGAWHGGWCWQRVNDRLTAQGHRVFAPTLTATFERIRSDDSWKTWVVDCGHDIMIDKPDELTSILVGLI